MTTETENTIIAAQLLAGLNLPELQQVAQAPKAEGGKRGRAETARISHAEFQAAMNALAQLANKAANVPVNLRNLRGGKAQTWESVAETATMLQTAPNVKISDGGNGKIYKLYVWAQDEGITATRRVYAAKILPKQQAQRQVFDVTFLEAEVELFGQNE